jgi:hypothetical protein
MEVIQNISAGSASVSTEDTTPKIANLNLKQEKKNELLQTANSIKQSVVEGTNVSEKGKPRQELDRTSDKVDSMLERNLTNDQKMELKGVYENSDNIFEQKILLKIRKKQLKRILKKQKV